MDILEIKRLRLRTEVGFSKHELNKQQEIVVNIQLKLSRKPGLSDCVEDSINMRTLTKDIISRVENKKYNLIETVAEDIARICVHDHGAPWVKVDVQKPNALRFSECSAVIIERRAKDFCKWENVHLSLGSNISPQENIARIIALLKETFHVLKISKAFRTVPVGYKNQDDFINMAVLIKTKLDPAALKKILREMETRLGRVSVPGLKNGPRVIDVDIALWGENTMQFNMTSVNSDISYVLPDPDILTLPHVIVPLADLTPDFIHPVMKKSLKAIAVEFCGKNFTSYFPIVHISDESNNDLLTNGANNFPAQMNGAMKEEPCENGKIASEQRVALVTGAAKRLGACITTTLHDLGYNVLIHYNTSIDEASSLSQKLNSVRPGSASVAQGNLALKTKQTAERIVEKCLEIWGRLDVLVNNASQFYPTEMGQVNEEVWDDLIQTNMSAPFFLSQAAFASLQATKGCIVNLVDIHADRPLVDHSVYCISKAGLHMCTACLAKEFAPHVRVNGISPGAILPPHSTHDSSSRDQLKHDVISKIPLQDIGSPSDITSAVEFLVSNANYVTGQIIRVDGGRTLNQ